MCLSIRPRSVASVLAFLATLRLVSSLPVSASLIYKSQRSATVAALRLLCLTAAGSVPRVTSPKSSLSLFARHVGRPGCAMPTNGMPTLTSFRCPIFEYVSDGGAHLSARTKSWHGGIPHDFAGS